jgi:virginiamycin B lyase
MHSNRVGLGFLLTSSAASRVPRHVRVLLRKLGLAVLLFSICAISRAEVIKWYSDQKTSGAPQFIIAGPDGALWFTEYTSDNSADKIGRISTAGVVTSEYTVPSPFSGPGVYWLRVGGITAGPDGALWFSKYYNCCGPNEGTLVFGGIGRITTAGVLSDYGRFTGDGSFGITASPDGALWFTDYGKIGRITTAGVLTEYTIPTLNSAPQFITAGPDGALWFTEYTQVPNSTSKIGRITTAGVITEYALPNNAHASCGFCTPNAALGDITTGPDGALWFTEVGTLTQGGGTNTSGGKIGRITTAGVVTEYALPTPNTGPLHITAGPDGELWFTEYRFGGDDQKIGRITTAGVMTEYSVNGYPNFITLGPDGALWVTAGAPFSGIGRISVPVFSVNAVTNVNNYRIVSPGEIVVLQGGGLGPSTLTQFALNDAGMIGTQLAGTQVLFNGIAAPIIYTSDTQVSAIVPYSTSVGTANVQVTYQGHTSSAFTVQIAPSAPALFTVDQTGRGQAAVLNQDGSYNNALNPAQIGSIISLFASGEGQTSPPGQDGKLGSSPLPQPVLKVTAIVGGQPAQVQYAGGAYGLVAGVMQVNIVIPSNIQTGTAVPIVINVGGFDSPYPGVTIWVAGN